LTSRSSSSSATITSGAGTDSVTWSWNWGTDSLLPGENFLSKLNKGLVSQAQVFSKPALSAVEVNP
jgi:hypothetical protein